MISLCNDFILNSMFKMFVLKSRSLASTSDPVLDPVLDPELELMSSFSIDKDCNVTFSK